MRPLIRYSVFLPSRSYVSKPPRVRISGHNPGQRFPRFKSVAEHNPHCRRIYERTPKKHKREHMDNPHTKKIKTDLEPIRNHRPSICETSDSQSFTMPSNKLSQQSVPALPNHESTFNPLRSTTNFIKIKLKNLITSNNNNTPPLQSPSPLPNSNPVLPPSTLSQSIKDVLPSSTPTSQEQTPQINENLKNAKTFKTHYGIQYSTTLDELTTVDSLTDSELEKELVKRQLAKPENKHKMNITTEEGGCFDIAKTKSEYKLTPIGIEYHKQVKNKDNIDPNNKIEFSTENLDLCIVIPPAPSDNTFIPIPAQKHLLAVYQESDKSYYTLGYFTGKVNKYHISDVQFHKFQKGETVILPQSMIGKKQYFIPFDNVKKLSTTPIIAKDGDKYIEFTGKKALFEFFFTERIAKPYEYYETTGVTKEHAVTMCKEYDKNTAKSNKHPKSTDAYHDIQKDNAPKVKNVKLKDENIT